MTATQPSQSQREVRSDLNAILHNVKERRHELVAGTGEQVAVLLQQAQDYNGEISKPQEEVIVSEILVIAAQTSHAVLRKLAQGGKSYTPADYIRNLKAHYVTDTDAQIVGAEDPSAFNWAAVGNSIAGWFRPAPCSFHMLGPMDAVAKNKRVAAQRKKKDVIAEAVRPDEVEVGSENQQETDRNMTIMYNLVKENEACLLSNLVLNHDSFAQTIENMFALSFLVRDRRVKLSDSAEGVRVTKAAPPVHKKKKGNRENAGGGNAAAGAAAGGNADDDDAERFQFVVGLDQVTWEQWKKVVNEEDTLMPHREHHQLRQNGSQEEDAEDDDGAAAAAAAPKTKRRKSSK